MQTSLRGAHTNHPGCTAVEYSRPSARRRCGDGSARYEANGTFSEVYRGLDFAHACAQLGLSHHYTKPYTPRTNGKAERFIQTALREWAYARAYHQSHQRRDALPTTWLHGYNWHRPHISLTGQPPINRLRLNRNNLLRLVCSPGLAVH
jgi:transposase InsO family protein